VPTSIAIPVKKARRAKTMRAGESGTEARPSPDSRPPAAVAAQPAHRYGIGERLRLANGGRALSRAEAFCTIVGRLPYEGYGSLLYRVQSEAEQFERIVPEIDLSREAA
jgi:hypothetical protein